MLTGIDLADGGDVGMRKHAFRHNVPAGDDVAAEFDHGFDLRLCEIGQGRVARIGDLDADGMRVDIRLALPVALAGMPGATVFGHKLVDRAVHVHDIVAGDFAFGRAEPVQRTGSVGMPV